MNFKAAILLLISFGTFASEKKEDSNQWLFDILKPIDVAEDKHQRNVSDDLFALFVANGEKRFKIEQDDLYTENGFVDESDANKENNHVMTALNTKEDLITFAKDQIEKLTDEEKKQENQACEAPVKDQPLHNIPQNLPQANNVAMQISPEVMSKIFKIASFTVKAMNTAQQQCIRVKEFYNPQAIAALGSQEDPESIVKYLKMEEYRRKVWGTQLTELIVKKKKLGFVKRKANEPEISMFWHPENSLIKKSFPVALTYEGKFFKLKSYDISSVPRKTPNHVNIRVKLIYETDSTSTGGLKNKIVLTVAQKQKTDESDNKNGQEIIIENIFHNSTQISSNLHLELLENATKISFEEIKRIWESTEDLESIVAKNVEQKKYATKLFTLAKRAGFLGSVFCFHLQEIAELNRYGNPNPTSYFSPLYLTANLFAISFIYFFLFCVAKPVIISTGNCVMKIKNLKN